MNTTSILIRTASTLGLAVAGLALAVGPAAAGDDTDAPATRTAAGGSTLCFSLCENPRPHSSDGIALIELVAAATREPAGDPAAGDYDADGTELSIDLMGGGSCWDWTDGETGESVTECY